MWEIPVLLLIYLLLYYLPKKAVVTTTKNCDELRRNKIKGTEKEDTHQNITFQLAEEMSAKVTKARTKGEQKEKEPLKVTKERGKLPVLEYHTLRENRVLMVNKLVPEKLVPHLKENKVIDQDDVEKIEKKCKDLRRKGAETMLNIVYNSGSWAFKKLIEVLQQTGYQELAQKLTVDLEKKRADPSSANTTKQRGLLSGIEFEVLRDNHERLVDELDSSVLKNHLFQNNLIDEDDLEKITKREEDLRKEGAEEMITIIYYSGQNVFPKLLKSLDEAGYKELRSKLDSDLKQKKKEGGDVKLKIDLNSVAFPKYPVSPALKLETIQGDDVVSIWQKKITKWKENNGGKIWCVSMNKWFQDHQFTSHEELKMVVKEWLSQLEKVGNRGCLEIDKINLILDVTETLLMLDSNNSTFHLDDMFIFMNIIQDFVPNCTVKKEIEEFVRAKTVEKERMLEQHRQVIKILKRNLEEVIEGKQSVDVQPIDTQMCDLAVHFRSVVTDVKELWQKLH